MESVSRKPFQGITNIIRFNRHYYIIAFIAIVLFVFIKNFLPYSLNIVASIIVVFTMFSIFISVVVSYYIYDCSNLYSLDWLNELEIGPSQQIVNINAGFDETSSIITKKYAGTNLVVFDFYDPAKHTEISIERARKVYYTFPGTKKINTNDVPLKINSVDYIFLILSAHEIRNETEQVNFFKQLANALNEKGKIVVVEHQRDIYNLIAYNLGFFHFFSNQAWKKTFTDAGLRLISESKITPFISSFILKKNGITS